MQKTLLFLTSILFLAACTSEKESSQKDSPQATINVLYENDFSSSDLGKEWNTAFCSKESLIQNETLYGAMKKGARHSAIYGLRFDRLQRFYI